MTYLFYVSLVGAAAAVLLTPVVRLIARQSNLLDRPAGRRKVHHQPTPLVLQPLSSVGSINGRQVSDAADASERADTARPRVLVLNRSYWPDVEATGQLLTELCEDLSTHYRMTVVAGQPNANPSKAHFKRWGRRWHKGVEVQRIWHSRMPKSSMIGRLVNLATYLLMATCRSLVMPRPDVIIVETDPPLLCCLGWILKHRYRCPLVIYLQDIYPDVAVAVGKMRDGRLVATLRRALHWLNRRADCLVVLSDDMRHQVLRMGVDPSRIHCIANWADTRLLSANGGRNQFRHEHGLANQFLVMYSGNMGLTQRLDRVIQVAAQLRDRDDILFALVGHGAERACLERRVRDMRLRNVRFFDYQPKETLAESLGAADVHLVPMAPELTELLMPSKLYGVLAVGRPIITMALKSSQLARIVTRYRVGLHVDYADTIGLIEAIQWCTSNRDELRSMGLRARALAVDEFDRSRATSAFGSMLADLIDR